MNPSTVIDTIQHSDALAFLKTLPDETYNSIITSPPYFAQRDYGNDAQIGLEDTPDEYIDALVEVFREARRVLKTDGTFWLNIGDTYVGATRQHPRVVRLHQAKNVEQGPAAVSALIANVVTKVAKPAGSVSV